MVAVILAPLAPPPTLPPARPYVSCIDGHVVEKLSDCPPLPRRDTNSTPPVGGGGGLLGGLLGGIL